jgi:hypothetical protein
MEIDNKISFFSGFIFTATTAINAMGWVQAAAVGLIGGFFGLLGKEFYYYVKAEIKSYLNDRSKNK